MATVRVKGLNSSIVSYRIVFDTDANWRFLTALVYIISVVWRLNALETHGAVLLASKTDEDRFTHVSRQQNYY